jgi:hypothetical protein
LFGCASNVGFDALVGSFVAPAGVTALVGCESTFHMCFQWGTVPPWWTFGEPPGCRPAAAIRPAFDMLPGSCNTYFPDRDAESAIVVETMAAPTSAVRFRVVVTAADSSASPVPAGEEVYAFAITINHQRTVNDGACEGCNVPATIDYGRLVLRQAQGASDMVIHGDWSNGDLGAFWQGGVYWLCSATPARNATWGRIKTLYR